jgi:hypothetical protein
MKMNNSSCAAKIRCARTHFSYCAAAHPRSLEGTLPTIHWPRGGIACLYSPIAPRWTFVRPVPVHPFCVFLACKGYVCPSATLQGTVTRTTENSNDPG